MKKFNLFLAFILMTVCVQMQAMKKVSPRQQKQVIAQISRIASKVKTMRCNFTQVSDYSFMDEKTTSVGCMSYNSSGGLLWQYTSPFKYTVTVNNGKIITRSGNHVNTMDMKSNKMYQNISRMMMNCVSGKNLNANRDFTVSLFAEGKEWIAYLYPKKPALKNMFRYIRLHFNNAKKMVEGVDMVHANGDNIQIRLSNIQVTYRQ